MYFDTNLEKWELIPPDTNASLHASHQDDSQTGFNQSSIKTVGFSSTSSLSSEGFGCDLENFEPVSENLTFVTKKRTRLDNESSLRKTWGNEEKVMCYGKSSRSI
ncbi:uncharacterized protein LOC120357205 [Solenopsis invicta]|uniref:uncharacterized protein LOC120357205 n=1 Tax=Solenopsis invicta TaxID=13686 RepID=UPI00193E70AB|nr:uncharacterized protein LOC120357205 [Solenopsis invicta]